MCFNEQKSSQKMCWWLNSAHLNISGRQRNTFGFESRFGYTSVCLPACLPVCLYACMPACMSVSQVSFWKPPPAAAVTHLRWHSAHTVVCSPSRSLPTPPSHTPLPSPLSLSFSPPLSLSSSPSPPPQWAAATSRNRNAESHDASPTQIKHTTAGLETGCSFILELSRTHKQKITQTHSGKLVSTGWNWQRATWIFVCMNICPCSS